MQGALLKKQLIVYFVGHFNGKSRKKNNLLFSMLMLLNLIKKVITHFHFAIVAYVHDAL